MSTGEGDDGGQQRYTERARRMCGTGATVVLVGWVITRFGFVQIIYFVCATENT